MRENGSFNEPFFLPVSYIVVYKLDENVVANSECNGMLRTVFLCE
jgi:hypothetical protein